ncbi:hypothetical protein [Sinosporangium siamense]|uniref:Uncharacterized protein n=1 Tax=Sinosporangium siamense TaxID=1367973 RepID=A0A919V7B2_9ACTN|nr:hypothetical protein [Sinosporangium siamense]GII91907.1 hypothetical protein Ssi02_21380 [Sinosporangium siamense]
MMTGAELLARTLVTGEVFGVSAGASREAIAEGLGRDFAEEVGGRSGLRVMRRDYGLIEATFSEEREWTCTWMRIELHRLALQENLLHEALMRHGIAFENYTPWSGVLSVLDVTYAFPQPQEFRSGPGNRSFSVDEGHTIALTVDDSDTERNDYPGNGDIWAIEMSTFALPAL